MAFTNLKYTVNDENLNPEANENEETSIQNLVDKYNSNKSIENDHSKVEWNKLKELIFLADKTKHQLDRIKGDNINLLL